MSQVFDRPDRSAPTGDLELTVQAAGRRTVIALEGELSVSGESVLRHCLDVVIETGCRHVVLDLSGLSSVDARALSSLVRVARFMRRRGGTLELRSSRPWPYDVVGDAGLSSLLASGT
jgi:anti-anti-sigma factor